MPGDVALRGTYLNDIRFSPDGRTGYITDSGTRGAIVVVALQSGKSFRALDGHPSTQIDKSVTVALDGSRSSGQMAASPPLPQMALPSRTTARRSTGKR